MAPCAPIPAPASSGARKRTGSRATPPRARSQWTTTESGIGTYYFERPFIQFAGFTFGRSQSYFDFYANAMYYTGYIGGPSSTGAAGTNVLAYTTTFGHGLPATIS